jgi:hypothetical protein
MMCGSDRFEAIGLVNVAAVAVDPAEVSARTDAPIGISDRIAMAATTRPTSFALRTEPPTIEPSPPRVGARVAFGPRMAPV